MLPRNFLRCLDWRDRARNESVISQLPRPCLICIADHPGRLSPCFHSRSIRVDLFSTSVTAIFVIIITAHQAAPTGDAIERHKAASTRARTSAVCVVPPRLQYVPCALSTRTAAQISRGACAANRQDLLRPLKKRSTSQLKCRRILPLLEPRHLLIRALRQDAGSLLHEARLKKRDGVYASANLCNKVASTWRQQPSSGL